MKTDGPLEGKLTRTSQLHIVKLQPSRLSGIFRTQEPYRFGGRYQKLKIGFPKGDLTLSNDCWWVRYSVIFGRVQNRQSNWDEDGEIELTTTLSVHRCHQDSPRPVEALLKSAHQCEVPTVSSLKVQKTLISWGLRKFLKGAQLSYHSGLESNYLLWEEGVTFGWSLRDCVSAYLRLSGVSGLSLGNLFS